MFFGKKSRPKQNKTKKTKNTREKKDTVGKYKVLIHIPRTINKYIFRYFLLFLCFYVYFIYIFSKNQTKKRTKNTIEKKHINTARKYKVLIFLWQLMSTVFCIFVSCVYSFPFFIFFLVFFPIKFSNLPKKRKKSWPPSQILQMRRFLSTEP